MKVSRVRRMRNRNVISIPPELESSGFVDGAQVVIQELPNGEVRLIPAGRLKAIVRDYGRRVVVTNRKALDTLAESDLPP